MSLLLSDRTLLDEFRAGTRQALEKVYQHYVDQVSLVVRRGFFTSSKGTSITVPGIDNPAIECEIIQETFVRAFDQKARLAYNGVSPYRPYLLRIAKNLMIDRARTLGREISSIQGQTDDQERELDIDNAIRGDIVLEENPAEQRHLRDQIALTQQYIAQCESLWQQYYELRYQQALPQLKTARKLDISRKKARIIEEQLRQGLKKYLVEKGKWP